MTENILTSMTGELVGYARVSTDDQDLTVQIETLKKAGVKADHLFSEKASGKKTDRQQLREAIKYARKGDVFLVTRMDRMSRSLKDLLVLSEELKKKGVHIRAVEQPIDTTSAAGEAFFGMLGVFAEFETNLRKERQAEGIARIMADPKLRKKTYKGGVPTVPKEKIIELHNEGLNQAQIRRRLSEMVDQDGKPLKAGRTSIWQVLKDAGLLNKA